MKAHCETHRTVPLDPAKHDLTADLAERLDDFIEYWRQGSHLPRLWRKPLVRIAAAADPMFRELRQAVAADHFLPSELLAGAQSVVVYFLPFVRELGRENQKAGLYAAKSWAEAYVATNQLIAAINDFIAEKLREIGHETAVTPATHNFDEHRLLSRWSHKHIAFIAGLGTFGRHRLLITAAGCCGRLGSLVTSVPLVADKRPGLEYCLAQAGYECSACVKKCVYGALADDTFDRHKCYQQLLINDRHYSELPLVDVCGKCGSEVPCSYRIPPKTARLANAE